MPNNRTRVYDGLVYHCDSAASTTTGNVSINFAGVWDGSTGASGWNVLDGGIQSGYGRGIHIVNENHLYVFGSFSSIGSSTNVNHTSNFNVAKWNGTNWESVGTLGNTNGEIKDAAYDETNDILYVVGSFTQIYGVSANRVAKYQSGTWSALQGGLNSQGYSCTLDSNYNLYVAGSFGGASNSSFVYYTSGFVKWNYTDNEWNGFTNTFAVSGSGWDIEYAPDTNVIYVCGNYSANLDGVSNTGRLAKYDISNDTWHSLGTFSSGTIYEVRPMVNNALYIGGSFDDNGDDCAYYDGSTWTGLGLNDGYTFNPTQTSFVPISLEADSKNTLYTIRNAGGMYILKDGSTQWNRLDNLDSDFNVGDTFGPTGTVEEDVDELIEATGFTGPTGLNPNLIEIEFPVDQTINDVVFYKYKVGDIVNVIPSVTIEPGIFLVSFSVSPTLPSGMILNPLTGTISGTPIEESLLALYTVTVVLSDVDPNSRATNIIQTQFYLEVDGVVTNLNPTTHSVNHSTTEMRCLRFGVLGRSIKKGQCKAGKCLLSKNPNANKSCNSKSKCIHKKVLSNPEKLANSRLVTRPTRYRKSKLLSIPDAKSLPHLVKRKQKSCTPNLNR